MEDRFDTLAKEVAQGLSRREALRRLGGSLAGTVLAVLGWSGAAGAAGKSAPPECSTYCAGLSGHPRVHCLATCSDCLTGGGTLCGDPTPAAVCCP